MTPNDLLDLTADEGAALLAAAADLAAPVVYYPEWTMLDLLVHTGSVHRRTTHIVRERLTERPERPYPPSEDPAVLPGWFEDGLREMIAVLRAADPAFPVWGFGKDPTVGFWITRMALETSVHRFDAEQALGQPKPLDPDLAVAGIDEFGWMHRPARPEDAPYTGDFLGLRATDREASWVVTVAEDRFRMRRGDPEGLPVVVAPASDLYLWLMGRLPADRVGAVDPAAAWWGEVIAAAARATR